MLRLSLPPRQILSAPRAPVFGLDVVHRPSPPLWHLWSPGRVAGSDRPATRYGRWPTSPGHCLHGSLPARRTPLSAAQTHGAAIFTAKYTCKW